VVFVRNVGLIVQMMAQQQLIHPPLKKALIHLEAILATVKVKVKVKVKAVILAVIVNIHLVKMLMVHLVNKVPMVHLVPPSVVVSMQVVVVLTILE
jgi:hypothetical protein